MRRYESNEMKSYIWRITGKAAVEEADKLELLCRRIVEVDIDRLPKSRWTKFKGRPSSIKWKDWGPDDVYRRLVAKLSVVSTDRKYAARLVSGPPPSAIAIMAAERIARVAISGGIGYLGALTATGNPALATVGALIAIGGEKAGRETLKATGKRGTWIGLVLEILTRILKFFEPKNDKGGER